MPSKSLLICKTVVAGVLICGTAVASTVESSLLELLEKLKSLRVTEKIQFTSPDSKDQYRDLEDELARLAQKVRELESRGNSALDEKFELLALYQVALSKVVVGGSSLPHSVPVLAQQPVEFRISASASTIVEEFARRLGVQLGVNGQVGVQSADMQSVYSSARAQVLVQLSTCIAGLGGFDQSLKDPRIVSAISYLRSYGIIGKIECAEIFGRVPGALSRNGGPC